MKTFTDTQGRAWMIQITVGAIKRVQALCGISLYKIIDFDNRNNPQSNLLNQLAEDPALLVDVLFAVCKPEADRLGVSDVEFGESMSGDVIEAATNALLDDLVDFFPEAKRLIFRKVLTATRKVQAAARKRLDAMLNDPKLDASIESRLNELLASSGNTQGSSASTPTV